MKEYPQNIVHDENDREMTLRVAELARKPPSLARFKEICDAAYYGLSRALRNAKANPFYSRRAWVDTIANLLYMQPMDEESAAIGIGFSLEDARFIEKCLSKLIPILSTHWQRQMSLRTNRFLPSCLIMMFSQISKALEQCRENGERFSLFNTVFAENELMPGRYTYKPLDSIPYRGCSYIPSIPAQCSAADVDEFLSHEDCEIKRYLEAWARDNERHEAVKKKLDEYNDSLGLEQISVSALYDFIKSYRGDVPQKPTEKIMRDLTAVFRFKPCELFDSETTPGNLATCETGYYRYSLDMKEIDDEVYNIQGAVDDFIKDQIAAAETVKETERLTPISEYFLDYRYEPFPDDAIKSILGEFKRVYEQKHKTTSDVPESAENATSAKPLSDRERKLSDWRTIRKICEKEHTAAGTTDGTGITEAARRAAQRGLLKYYKNARSAASAYSQAMSRYTVTNWNTITLPEEDE